MAGGTGVELVTSLAVFARLTLGLVFITAGAAKLIDRDPFERFIGSLGRVLREKARLMSSIIPLMELSLGSLLIVGVGVRIVSPIALGLLTVFTVTIWVVVRRRDSTSCGCFGRLDGGPVSRRTLARNITFMCLGVLTLLGNSGEFGVDGLIDRANPVDFNPVFQLVLAELALGLSVVVSLAGLWLRGRALHLPGPRDLGEFARPWYGEHRSDLDRRYLEPHQETTRP